MSESDNLFKYSRIALSLTALMLSSTVIAQNTSLPAVSAPSAYGDSVNAGVAAASSTARALAPPAGVKGEVNGGFSLGITFGTTWHTNPERRLDEPDDGDIAFLLTPNIGYSGSVGRHSFEIGYSTNSESFQDFETEDSDWWRLNGALQLDMSEILIGDIYASRTEGEEERGAAGSRTLSLTGEDEYREDVIGGRITLGRRSNLLQIYVGAEEGTLSYLNNGQDFRDRDRSTAEAGLFFNIGPRTSIFIRAQETEFDYLAGNPSIDSTENSLTAGVAWEPTEALSMTLQAGNLEKDFDDPSLVGYDGGTYLGKLTWQPRDRTVVSLYASKATEESSDIDSTFYVSEVIGADLSQRLGDRTSLTLRYSVSDNEYSDGRFDDITDYGLSLGYAARNWLSFGLSFNSIDYNSTNVSENYEDEVISFFVSITPTVGS